MRIRGSATVTNSLRSLSTVGPGSLVASDIAPPFDSPRTMRRHCAVSSPRSLCSLGADTGNRTPIPSLARTCSTTKPYPLTRFLQRSDLQWVDYTVRGGPSNYSCFGTVTSPISLMKTDVSPTSLFPPIRHPGRAYLYGCCGGTNLLGNRRGAQLSHWMTLTGLTLPQCRQKARNRYYDEYDRHPVRSPTTARYKPKYNERNCWNEKQ